MGQNLKKSIEEDLDKEQKKAYQTLVKETEPKKPILKNVIMAFFVGGLICTIGQLILELYLYWGMAMKEGITVTLITIIFFGALLTGLGLYDNISKHAGAGSIVPISGFANSIVSPAMEWKREGIIGGLTTKMFTAAGPVIVCSISMALVLGLIKYLYLLFTGGL